MLFIKRSAKPLLCLLGFWRNHWLYLILFNDVVLNKEKKACHTKLPPAKASLSWGYFLRRISQEAFNCVQGVIWPRTDADETRASRRWNVSWPGLQKKKNRAKKKRTQKQQGITTTITDKDPRESRQRCNECGMRRSEDLQPRPPPLVDRHSGNRERCNEVSPNKQLALA